MPFRRWLANVSLALAVAGIIYFPSAVSVSAQPGSCIPITVILSKIGEDTRLLELRILEGAKLQKAVAIFNATMDMDIPWPVIYFALRDDGYSVLMAGDSEVVCVGLGFDKDSTRLLLKTIYGDAI